MRRSAAVADGLAILAFATVGQLSHNGSVSIEGYAHNALPTLGGWYGAAAAFRLYRQGGSRRFALTWLSGVTAGVGARAALLGRDLDSGQAGFLATSLIFVLAFVLSGRALMALAARSGPAVAED